MQNLSMLHPDRTANSSREEATPTRTPAAVPLPASCFMTIASEGASCALVTRASAVFWAPPPTTASASPDCAAASGLRVVTRLPLPAPCALDQTSFSMLQA